MEPGWDRDFEFHEGWGLCLCGGGRGGSSGGGGGIDGSGRGSGVGDSGESIVLRSSGGELRRSG